MNITSQRLEVLRYFSEHTATMKKCSIDTGIDRANVCRHVAALDNLLTVIRRDVDPLTGHLAGFYHTTFNTSDHEKNTNQRNLQA